MIRSCKRSGMGSMDGRRGDTASPVIMWIGVILALMIVAAWFLMHSRPVQQDMDTTQRDLRAIGAAMDDACESVSYTKQYNPWTEKGMLTLNQSAACINTTLGVQCTALPCQAASTGSIDLAGVTEITITGSAGNVGIAQVTP